MGLQRVGHNLATKNNNKSLIYKITKMIMLTELSIYSSPKKTIYAYTHTHTHTLLFEGLPGGSVVKTLSFQCMGHRFSP